MTILQSKTYGCQEMHPLASCMPCCQFSVAWKQLHANSCMPWRCQLAVAWKQLHASLGFGFENGHPSRTVDYHLHSALSIWDWHMCYRTTLYNIINNLLYKILRNKSTIKYLFNYLNAVAYIIVWFNDTVVILYTVYNILSMCTVYFRSVYLQSAREANVTRSRPTCSWPSRSPAVALYHVNTNWVRRRSMAPATFGYVTLHI